MPELVVNNRLLLQLYHLKLQADKTCEDITDFASTIMGCRKTRLRPMMEKSYREVSHLSTDGKILQEFLSVKLSFVGPLLTRENVSMIELLGDITTPRSKLIHDTNAVVLDLLDLKKKQDLTVSWAAKAVCYLSGTHWTEEEILKELKALSIIHGKKSKGRHRNPDEYNTFIDATFFDKQQSPLTVKPPPQKRIKLDNCEIRNQLGETESNVPIPVLDSPLQSASKAIHIKKLTGYLETSEEKLGNAKETNKTLKKSFSEREQSYQDEITQTSAQLLLRDKELSKCRTQIENTKILEEKT